MDVVTDNVSKSMPRSLLSVTIGPRSLSVKLLVTLRSILCVVTSAATLSGDSTSFKDPFGEAGKEVRNDGCTSRGEALGRKRSRRL